MKGYQKRQGARCNLRTVSTLPAWLRAKPSPGVSVPPPPHPRWPLFPQKSVQRSRASLGRPLWFFSMEPFPGLTVCCRYWCGTPRGLSLSPAWVLRPGLYLVSTHRHQWVKEVVTVLSSLLWGLTLVPGSAELRHTGRLRVTKTRMLWSSQEGLIVHVPNQLSRKRHHTRDGPLLGLMAHAAHQRGDLTFCPSHDQDGYLLGPVDEG